MKQKKSAGRRSAAGICLSLLLLLSACLPMTEEPDAPPEESTPIETAASPAAPPPPFALPWYGGAPDPLGTDSAVNLALLPLVYEGLFALDHAFTPQPVLCLRAEVAEDGTVWTLHLRDDVVFSDGTPLTAALVRDCLRKTASGSLLYAARLADVAAIEAYEGRVVVTLRAPNAEFPALLDFPVFLPDDPAVGTGPYVFTESALEPAPGWWRGEPLPVARIPLIPVSTADEMIHAFDAGQITLVTADPTGSTPLGYAGSYETWEYPTATMLYIGYQTARGPCADAALRRALALCADRATITASLLAGHATAAALPIHPAAWRDRALEAEVEYDPLTAGALLDELGYRIADDGLRKKGRTALELTLLVNNENPFKLAVAEYLADDLGKRGISVVLKRVGFEAYQAALHAGAFDLYLGECRLSPDFDVTPLVARGGALNFGGYHAEEASALLAALRAAGRGDPDAARALYGQLLTDAPFTPLCFKSGTVLTRWGRVSGAAPAAGNVFYGFRNWTIK